MVPPVSNLTFRKWLVKLPRNTALLRLGPCWMIFVEKYLRPTNVHPRVFEFASTPKRRNRHSLLQPLPCQPKLWYLRNRNERTLSPLSRMKKSGCHHRRHQSHPPWCQNRLRLLPVANVSVPRVPARLTASDECLPRDKDWPRNCSRRWMCLINSTDTS